MILKRSLAVLLSASLLWTSGDFAQAAAPLSPLAELTPPTRLGQVIDSFNLSNPTAPRVILIQDLHAHYGVQKNIAGILEFLATSLRGERRMFGARRGNLSISGTAEIATLPSGARNDNNSLPFALAVEGASGPVDSSVMALFPDQKIKQAAADYLMREGELSGAEYFTIMRSEPKGLVGVEDERYYTLHRELFRKTWAKREQLTKSLQSIQADLLVLRRTVYSRPLKKFQSREDAFQAGKLGFEDYFDFLATEAKAAGMEFQRPDLSQNSAIDQAWEQAETLTYLLKIQKAQTPQEKDLVQVEHDLGFLIKVANLQATEREIRTFGPRINQFVALANALTHKSFDEATLRELISSSIDYYAFALARNKPMVENTLALLSEQRQPGTAAFPEKRQSGVAVKGFSNKEYHPPVLGDADSSERRLSGKPQIAVLVAGGFHTRQMTDILKSCGIAYAVISPNLDQVNPADQELYVKRLNGQLLTTEEILATSERRAAPQFAGLFSRKHDTLAVGLLGSALLGAQFLSAGFSQYAAEHHQTISAALPHFQEILKQTPYIGNAQEIVQGWLKHIPALLGLGAVTALGSIFLSEDGEPSKDSELILWLQLNHPNTFNPKTPPVWQSAFVRSTFGHAGDPDAILKDLRESGYPIIEAEEQVIRKVIQDLKYAQYYYASLRRPVPKQKSSRPNLDWYDQHMGVDPKEFGQTPRKALGAHAPKIRTLRDVPRNIYRTITQSLKWKKESPDELSSKPSFEQLSQWAAEGQPVEVRWSDQGSPMPLFQGQIDTRQRGGIPYVELMGRHRELSYDKIIEARLIYDDLLLRVKGHFNEEPGLRLTAKEAARLIGIDEANTNRLLQDLQTAGYLTRTRDGAYVRNTGSEYGHPVRAANQPRPIQNQSGFKRVELFLAVGGLMVLALFAGPLMYSPSVQEWIKHLPALLPVSAGAIVAGMMIAGNGSESAPDGIRAWSRAEVEALGVPPSLAHDFDLDQVRFAVGQKAAIDAYLDFLHETYDRLIVLVNTGKSLSKQEFMDLITQMKNTPTAAYSRSARADLDPKLLAPLEHIFQHLGSGPLGPLMDAREADYAPNQIAKILQRLSDVRSIRHQFDAMAGSAAEPRGVVKPFLTRVEQEDRARLERDIEQLRQKIIGYQEELANTQAWVENRGARYQQKREQVLPENNEALRMQTTAGELRTIEIRANMNLAQDQLKSLLQQQTAARPGIMNDPRGFGIRPFVHGLAGIGFLAAAGALMYTLMAASTFTGWPAVIAIVFALAGIGNFIAAFMTADTPTKSQEFDVQKFTPGRPERLTPDEIKVRIILERELRHLNPTIEFNKAMTLAFSKAGSVQIQLSRHQATSKMLRLVSRDLESKHPAEARQLEFLANGSEDDSVGRHGPDGHPERGAIWAEDHLKLSGGILAVSGTASAIGLIMSGAALTSGMVLVSGAIALFGAVVFAIPFIKNYREHVKEKKAQLDRAKVEVKDGAAVLKNTAIGNPGATPRSGVLGFLLSALPKASQPDRVSETLEANRESIFGTAA